jgi:mannose-6-phosphate isomerase
MIERRPYKLKNKIQNYSWGTKDSEAYIPQLLGMTPESGIPYAELWIGTHNNAPSKISIDDSEQSLADYIELDAAAILGEKVAQQFNNKLPFLFKVLSIAEPLSIQTHPDKDQAEMLHSVDPDNYSDDNHKPEIAIAIDKLEALAGFKSVEAVKNICIEYDELTKFMGLNNFNRIFENSVTGESEKLRQLYSLLVHKALDEKDEYRLLLKSLRDRFLTGTDKKEEQLFLKLYERYDKDIGLLTMLFLNYYVLSPGEAIFTKAGIPHAYLSGNIIECMANSDNVIRAGLTPKFVDVKNLLKVLSFESGGVDMVTPEKSGSKTEYNTDAEEFKVVRIELSENKKVKIKQKSQLSIFLLVEGTAEIKWNNGNMKLNKGDSIFIPADTKSISLESNNASGYLATVNL